MWMQGKRCTGFAALLLCHDRQHMQFSWAWAEYSLHSAIPNVFQRLGANVFHHWLVFRSTFDLFLLSNGSRQHYQAYLLKNAPWPQRTTKQKYLTWCFSKINGFSSPKAMKYSLKLPESFINTQAGCLPWTYSLRLFISLKRAPYIRWFIPA